MEKSEQIERMNLEVKENLKLTRIRKIKRRIK